MSLAASRNMHSIQEMCQKGELSVYLKKKKNPEKERKRKKEALVIFASFIYIREIMTCVQSNSSDAKEISHASSARTTLADFHIYTRWMIIDVDFHGMKHFYLNFQNHKKPVNITTCSCLFSYMQ